MNSTEKMGIFNYKFTIEDSLKSLNRFCDDIELVAESMFESHLPSIRRITELAMVTVIRNFTLCFINVIAAIEDEEKSVDGTITHFRNLGLAEGLNEVFKSIENPQNVDRFCKHYEDYRRVAWRLIEYCKKNDLMKKELVS